MYGIRGYEVSKSNNTPVIYSQLIPVPSTNRTRLIIPGMFVVLTTGGVDGAEAADTANGSTRKIVGLVTKVYNADGKIKEDEQLGITEAGFVQVVVDRGEDILYSGVEDGVGGAISFPTNTSVASTAGSPLSLTSELPAPEPVCTDMLDSSTANSTPTQHAFRLINVATRLDGINNVNKVYDFKVNASFMAPAE